MATLEDLATRVTDLKAQIAEIDQAADGRSFNDDEKARWNELNNEVEALQGMIRELKARAARIAELDDRGSVEDERQSFQPRKRDRVPDDPTDIAEYRNRAESLEELGEAYQEGARRIVDRMRPAEHVDLEGSQARMEHILSAVDSPNDRLFAKRVIATSSAAYQRAFGKLLANVHRTPDEERALSMTSGEGGYAVPVVLDPTVILVSAGVVNPVRRIARVETITGNTWNGVSSTGVTAAYGAENTETSDNAPALVQPTLAVEKAQAFIPYSIEIGQDWGALVAEMSRLFAEAKDDLESSAFLTGLGSGSNEPQGLIAAGGATAVVTSAATATFAVADLYSLENGLSPRPRARASIVANRAAFQKVRQFDTSGGADLWVQLQYGSPATLIGYPAYEWSSYSSAVTTSGSTIMTIGDFSKFLIVDRVGMDVEVIPHIFATANNRPSGQRGLYCYWRNSSTVLTPGLQANSAFVSLKLL